MERSCLSTCTRFLQYANAKLTWSWHFWIDSDKLQWTWSNRREWIRFRSILDLVLLLSLSWVGKSNSKQQPHPKIMVIWREQVWPKISFPNLMMHQDQVEKNLSVSTAISQDRHYHKLNRLLNQTSDHSKTCNRHLVTEKGISMLHIKRANMEVLLAVCLNLTIGQLRPRLQIFCKDFYSIFIMLVQQSNPHVSQSNNRARLLEETTLTWRISFRANSRIYISRSQEISSQQRRTLTSIAIITFNKLLISREITLIRARLRKKLIISPSSTLISGEIRLMPLLMGSKRGDLLSITKA